MQIGSKVLIRGDDGQFTGPPGVLIAKQKSLRGVRYNYFEGGRTKEAYGVFNADDIRAAPKQATPKPA